MKDIAIYGAGGLGRELYCAIRNEGFEKHGWNFIGFFDDKVEKDAQVFDYGSVLGNIDTLNLWNKELSILFGIGNSTTIQTILNKIQNPNIDYPNYIHNSNTFADKKSFNIGKGNILIGHNHFSCNVSLGDFNFCNGDVVFGHDNKVGSFNTFMPDVRISGEVTIGNRNFFGVRSTVLQQIKIKDNTKLAAGSVLMTKPKEGELHLGVPAKIFKI